MALDRLHLRKFLQIAYAAPALRISLIRGDIRNEIAKESGGALPGGADFYGPFWADAKAHVANRSDLSGQTEIRVASNGGRSRLYPRLRDGFLTWWNERRRWTNEELEFFPNSARGWYKFDELDAIIKVENLLSLRVRGGVCRFIYPYFSERPLLSEEGARIGLWLISEALPACAISDIRILDVIRAESFSTERYPLRGDEETVFVGRYTALLSDWEELWQEYY